MYKRNIFMILVQIDEAHTDKWPVGLDHPPTQKDMEDRLKRARDFVAANHIDDKAFKVVVDCWSNDFAEFFHSWPDKYYCLDANYKVVAKSEYGRDRDALVNLDCVDLIQKMLE